MLILRKEQEVVLRAAVIEAFVQRVLGHLRTHFFEDVEMLGPAQTRRVVELGMARAQRHGVTVSTDVYRYVVAMFLFGGRFDEDPLLPWAAAALAEPHPPARRLDHLFDEGFDFLELAGGAGGEYYRRAMVRLLTLPFRDLTSRPVRETLDAVYPRRCRAFGDTILRGLVDRAERAAAVHGLADEPGVIVYALMAFMLGTHFDRDPRYPWAVEALAAARTRPADERAAAVHGAGLHALERYVALNRARRSA